MNKIALIVLAAGGSTRMENQVKQLLPWKNTTLLQHTIDQSLASNANAVFVVLGANIKIIQRTLNPINYKIIENSNWNLGLGNSIATAITYLKNNEEYYDAALLVLADQPLMDAAHYNKLILEFKKRDKNLVATAYENKNGVPAIFGNVHFEALAKLNKDFGATEIIKNSDMEVVSAQDNLYDIDTLEDYENLIRLG